MNIAQTIFALVFALCTTAIFFSNYKFNLLDLAGLKSGIGAAWGRFLLTLLLLFLAPLAYFWFAVQQLKGLASATAYTNFWYFLIIVVQGNVGFGFYSLFFGCLLMKSGERFLFYDEEEANPLAKELENRPEDYARPWDHIGPGLIWVGITALLLFLLTTFAR